jgi:hypothetical protein
MRTLTPANADVKILIGAMIFFALLAILTHPGWLLQLWASGFGILSGAGVNLKLTPEQYRKPRRIDESPFTFPLWFGDSRFAVWNHPLPVSED